MADQLSLGCLIQLQYEAATPLLDSMIKTNKETEKDKIGQNVESSRFLSQKVIELEAMYKKKDRYISSHKFRKLKEYEG